MILWCFRVRYAAVLLRYAAKQQRRRRGPASHDVHRLRNTTRRYVPIDVRCSCRSVSDAVRAVATMPRGTVRGPCESILTTVYTRRIFGRRVTMDYLIAGDAGQQAPCDSPHPVLALACLAFEHQISRKRPTRAQRLGTWRTFPIPLLTSCDALPVHKSTHLTRVSVLIAVLPIRLTFPDFGTRFRVDPTFGRIIFA
jgi:hypothetical protein